MFRDLFLPLRRLPFPHLGLLASMATQVSGGIACGSTCLLNQHEAPYCLLPWYQLPPMGSFPMVLSSTNLPKKPEHHAIKVPTNSIAGKVVPANQVPLVVLPLEASEVLLMAYRRDGFWKHWISRPRGVAWSRKSTGQGAATQMGAPICLQWPGPGQDILDQAPVWVDRYDTFQDALPMYTPAYVQRCEGPSPGKAGYWCHQEVTESMG